MANIKLYPGEKMKSPSVNLPERLLEVARRLGGGSVSRGVQIALERAEKQTKQEGEKS